jgi:hypothetical protein
MPERMPAAFNKSGRTRSLRELSCESRDFIAVYPTVKD